MLTAGLIDWTGYCLADVAWKSESPQALAERDGRLQDVEVVGGVVDPRRHRHLREGSDDIVAVLFVGACEAILDQKCRPVAKALGGLRLARGPIGAGGVRRAEYLEWRCVTTCSSPPTALSASRMRSRVGSCCSGRAVPRSKPGPRTSAGTLRGPQPVRHGDLGEGNMQGFQSPASAAGENFITLGVDPAPTALTRLVGTVEFTPQWYRWCHL